MSKLWTDPGLQDRYGGFHVIFPPAGKPGQRVAL